MKNISGPDLEHIESGASVETALFVHCTEDSGLCSLLWRKRGGEVKFEAFGDEILDFELVPEDVEGGPGLSEGQTVNFVGPFTLEISRNVIRLGVAGTLDFEGYIGGCLGLDFQRSTVGVVVLVEQIARGLAKVLFI